MEEDGDAIGARGAVTYKTRPLLYISAQYGSLHGNSARIEKYRVSGSTQTVMFE